MNKFWRWFEKVYIDNVSSLLAIYGKFDSIPKQGLIGYMIEYLVVNGHISFRRIGHWIGDAIQIGLLRADIKMGAEEPAEGIYELLKERIEEIE